MLLKLLKENVIRPQPEEYFMSKLNFRRCLVQLQYRRLNIKCLPTAMKIIIQLVPVISWNTIKRLEFFFKV